MKILFKSIIACAALTACFAFNSSDSDTAFAAQKDPHTAYSNGTVSCYNLNTNGCGVKVPIGVVVK